MNPILTEERAHAINGVEGRMFGTTAREDEAPGAFCRQRWGASRTIQWEGREAQITVEMRFDDDCRNGHNTFSITGEITLPRRRDSEVCGCIHDEIAKYFPELRPFIPWHLTSSDAPMHYLANAIYFAGDRDHWGLRKGEKRIRTNRDGLARWELQAVTGGPMGLGVKISDTPTGLKYTGADTVPLFILTNHHTGAAPPVTPRLRWVQSYETGEGKEREFDKARAAAVWPEATDEELSQDPEALRAALEARHPALMAEFKALIVGAGFLWERQEVPA